MKRSAPSRPGGPPPEGEARGDRVPVHVVAERARIRETLLRRGVPPDDVTEAMIDRYLELLDRAREDGYEGEDLPRSSLFYGSGN